MRREYSEDALVEAGAQEVLEGLGWTVLYAWHAETFGEEGLLGRDNKHQVILTRYLQAALVKLNPDLPKNAYDHAIEQIIEPSADKPLGQINKEKYELLTQGVEVEFQNSQGKLIKKCLRVFDFTHPKNNTFIAVRQFEIIGKCCNRRPDIIGFVNGIPLVFFELKVHHKHLSEAYNDNLSNYKKDIAHLFHCNAFVVLSNGIDSRVGTITSPYKFFLPWKRIEENDKGKVSMDTLLRGTCDPTRLMDIFQNFLLFDASGGDIAKIMAKNHQYIGVNRVIDQMHHIDNLKNKLGVFWHTQGAGKSYAMVFLCQKIHRILKGAYTFLMVTDRSELERQLYDTFTSVGAIVEATPKTIVAKSQQNLRQLLTENHRYLFTLIHKFSINPKKEKEYPRITDRSNIIVISDEAHRTQGGKFAQNMRFFAIPNATYLGFTGTPIIKGEREITKNIFGEYVSTYDFNRAVEDGATLPLIYLNQGEKLRIDRPDLNDRMAEILSDEDLDEAQRKKLQRQFASDYPVLTATPRLKTVAKDLVWHFNERGYQGKAMLVTIDKPTALRMHNLIMQYWPAYIQELESRIHQTSDQQESLELNRHLQRVRKTEVCVVISPEQNEVAVFEKMGLDIAFHRQKIRQRDLEKEFKDPDNLFRLVIVCNMWTTGFDVPCLSTIYLDKPLSGHTLIQTIGRANRVYDDEKENGLIVDYGNVYKQLEKAYFIYGKATDSHGDSSLYQPQKPFDRINNLAVELEVMIKEIQRYLLDLGFDLHQLMSQKTAIVKLAYITEAINAICLNDETRVAFEHMASAVLKKFKSLYPEAEAKKFIKEHNAIEAIYRQLKKSVKSENLTEVMLRLQKEVDKSISIKNSNNPNNHAIDLSHLDFDQLKQAFKKSKNKNTTVFDLRNAIKNKLDKMLKQNPTRISFYERYQKIIEEYNKGKDLQAVEKAFSELSEFIRELSEEEARAVKEQLDEETLAIFDLLRESHLSKREEDAVKKVAIELLKTLKQKKLKIKNWWMSTQVSAQIKIVIVDSLNYLPPSAYSDQKVNHKVASIYQHICNYYAPAMDSARL